MIQNQTALEVALEYGQHPGMDYEETFAPVMRILFSIVLNRKTRN